MCSSKKVNPPWSCNHQTLHAYDDAGRERALSHDRTAFCYFASAVVLNTKCTVTSDHSCNRKTSSEVLDCFRHRRLSWVSVPLVAEVSTVKNFNIAGHLLTFAAARSKDGLYEPALADSEREAVADLLQYLENVRTFDFLNFCVVSALDTDRFSARRDRFLFWGTAAIAQYLGLF